VRLAIAFLAISSLVPRPSHAQRAWRTEDRAVVGEMLTIFAVASSFERTYVVSADQVLYRDFAERGWRGPFVAPGFGELQQSRGAVVDPLDRSLWIVTATGWLRYDATLDAWDRGDAGGNVLAAGLDRTRPIDGLFLRLSSGWVVATRNAGSALPTTRPPRSTDLLRAASVGDLARGNPQLASLSSGTLLGPGLRPARITAAAEASDRSGWWLGTDGQGLLWLPFGSVTPEPRPLGLPGEVVGAIVGVPGGAWAVTDRSSSAGAALTRISEELNEFGWYFGDRVFGQRFSTVRSLRIVDSLLWLGTDQGGLALTRRGERVRWVTELEGLPDRRVLAIAARRGRVVFGTAAGIAELTDSGATRIAPRYAAPTYALALAGDTTWVGTPNGLFAHVPGEEDLRQAPGWDAFQLLNTPVPSLLWHGDTLVALTDRALLWRDPRTGGWTLGPEIALQVGRARALADGAHGVWVAGSRGVGFARLGGGIERTLPVGSALPGEPWDLSTQGEWLWVATSKGVVRFRREGVEP
jgi:hypothetical protein